jgi:hypothetical protein
MSFFQWRKQNFRTEGNKSHMIRKITTQSPLPGEVRIQEFLDMISPSVIKFNTDHFICGNTYRCVWALREYPTWLL